MRAIIDEGVPRALARYLREAGCSVRAFPNEWKGTKNGRLLALLKSAGYDCLISCDKNLRHQQNLIAADMALIVLPSQALHELRQHVSSIANAARTIGLGDVIVISANTQENRSQE